MKIHYKLCALSLLIFSTNSFCYESYDYSSMDEGDYYYSRGDNEYRNSDDRREYSRPKRLRHSEQVRYSPRARDHYSAGAGRTFVFDPKQLRWFAYYNGDLVNTGRASGGRFYCADIRRPCKTPVGVFHVGQKGGPGCKSSKYPIGRGNAPMPWCMFFHGGYAIHGSGSVPGYNASHGCIRVPSPDARWLSQRFMSPGTKVVVKSYR